MAGLDLKATLKAFFDILSKVDEDLYYCTVDFQYFGHRISDISTTSKDLETVSVCRLSSSGNKP